MYTITLEVNQICNLRCTYCYLGRKTNQKMSEQIAYKGLEIAFLNAENHRDRRLWVDFVGGEALLSLSFLKHLVDYIEGQALKRNILVTYSITTNGTILNDEILAWLIKYRIHLKVRRIFMNDVKLENVELQEEEVNIYTPACGETRYKCIADCLMGNCFITCDY